MINIQRPYPGPARLWRNGSLQTKRDCNAYDESPEQYKSGVEHFPRKHYHTWQAVKNALWKMHHGKCCYCEKRVEPGDLHIEHFRPRGAFRQTSDGANEYPGYYWLAYSWDNLLLACPTCNRAKSSKFPLKYPNLRARCHNDELGNETPLLVNPTVDDPRDHIRFSDDAPYPLTKEGQCTIEELQLHRSELFELRLNHLRLYKCLKLMLLYQSTPPQQAVDLLKEAMQKQAQFSSMIIDMFDSTESLLDCMEQSAN